MIKGICQTLEDSFPNDEGIKTRRPTKDRAMGYGRESMEKKSRQGNGGRKGCT